MKHRSLAVVLIALLAAAPLAGCSGFAPSSPSASPKDTVVIAASFYPIYIMLLNVAGNVPGVDVVDMTEPTAGCLHDYAVTTADMAKLERASILVINGADMESFMGKVIARFPHLEIVDSSEGIELITGESGEANPHVWVSISNAMQQVKTIAAKLSALDPDRASAYGANAHAYVAKLEAEKAKMHAALDHLPHRDIVTFHEAFPYFAAEFDLNIAGVIEREPGSEPSARELSDSIDRINSLGVKALFAEPQYPPTAAESIARETGAKVYTLDPGVTGPMEPDAYLNIMDENLKVLEEALK